MKIKKDELDKVINSLYKEKELRLPFNEQKKKELNNIEQIKSNLPILYLIDGYNLMHVYEETKTIINDDILSARDKIINLVCDFQGYSNYECVLVFDAYKNNIPITSINKDSNIVIVYTKAKQSADMYIDEKVKELNEKYKIFVVTSDNYEQLNIIANNAYRISCKEFINKYDNYKERQKNKNKINKHQPLKELRKLLFED